MIYSSVLSPELLQKSAISPIKVQEQIAQMLNSITCTTLPLDIHKWYNDIISSIKPGEKHPRAADIGVPDASLYYTEFVDIAIEKSLCLGMHGHGFSCKKGKNKKGKHMCRLVYSREDFTMERSVFFSLFYLDQKSQKEDKGGRTQFPFG